MLIILNPSGPLQLVFNQIRGISIAGVSTAICTCTMQVRLTTQPMGRTGCHRERSWDCIIIILLLWQKILLVSNLRIFTQLTLHFAIENIMKSNHSYIFNEGK